MPTFDGEQEYFAPFIRIEQDEQVVLLFTDAPPPERDWEYARLIAAAPDLLAACELAVAEMTDTWPPNDWQMNFDTIRAAIAKAKGEA